MKLVNINLLLEFIILILKKTYKHIRVSVCAQLFKNQIMMEIG